MRPAALVHFNHVFKQTHMLSFTYCYSFYLHYMSVYSPSIHQKHKRNDNIHIRLRRGHQSDTITITV